MFARKETAYERWVRENGEQIRKFIQKTIRNSTEVKLDLLSTLDLGALAQEDSLTYSQVGIYGDQILLSGTGAATSFNIPHGMGVIPLSYFVSSLNAASAGISYLTADATNITIHYTVAPAAGTDNLYFCWGAYGSVAL